MYLFKILECVEKHFSLQYERMKRVEEECTRELQLKEQKRKELYAKQGRGSQFTTKVKIKKIVTP